MARMRKQKPVMGHAQRGWLAAAALAIAVGVSGAQQAGAKETCWTEGPSQFADAMHFCVSSVLPPQGKSSYGPKNLVGYYGSTGAWCEGIEGQGRGETITLRIDRGPAFRRLQIRNGYDKSAKSFRDNSRIKRMRITTDTGVDTTLDLVDQPGEQPIYLPVVARHRWVKLEILDVYPGARYADTCVSAIKPDFVYEEELLQGQEVEPSSPSPSPPAPVPTLPPETTPAQPPLEGDDALETLPALKGTKAK